MAISFKCPHCTAPLSAADSAAGNNLKCPECRQWVRLPELAEFGAPAAKPAPVAMKSAVVRGQATKSVLAPAPARAAGYSEPSHPQNSTAPALGPSTGVHLAAGALMTIFVVGVSVSITVILIGSGILWWLTRPTGPVPQASGPATAPVESQPVERGPEPKFDPIPDPKADPKPNPKPETNARQAPAGWQTYAEKDGRFSVYFPEGTVDVRSNKHPQTGALSSAYVLQDLKMAMEYTVLVVDAGPQAPARGTLLEAFKAEAAKGQTLVAEQRLKLGDYFGVEQQLVGPGKLTVARVFEVSGKIFAVAVSLTGPERPESGPNIKTFLDSFKITAAGAALITVDATPPPNLGLGKTPPGWQVVVAPDNSFSVLLPEGMITANQQTDQRGDATFTTIAVNDPRRMLTCRVTVTTAGRTPLPPAALLAAFKKWFSGGPPLKGGEQRIMMGETPGVAFTYIHQGWLETVHAYVLPDRVIAVTVKIPQDRPDTAQNTSTCLDSFKIPAGGPNLPGRPPGPAP